MGLKSSQGPWNQPNKMSAVVVRERCGVWSNQMKKAHNLKLRGALLTPPLSPLPAQRTHKHVLVPAVAVDLSVTRETRSGSLVYLSHEL